MAGEFQVSGHNAAAQFTLRVHRGDGMALLAMNWRQGKPPMDFVGFAIEYKEPGGNRFFALKNFLCFPKADGSVNRIRQSTLLAPIQKFRWVHFPRNAELAGDFTYRVTPVFMNNQDELSYGDAQTVAIELRRETYPGKLNVTFTRGFVSSQAFVERYAKDSIPALLPKEADDGLTFVPNHPKAKEALAWMGFEARHAILELLDQAFGDKKAQVRVVAYELSEPDVVAKLEKLRGRLKVIIDDSGDHGKTHSAESKAADRLKLSAGPEQVKRQHMGQLQHNKTIVVDGPKVKAVVCGSTNFSWRGFFVQSNNALILRGEKAIKPFLDAFGHYWDHGDAAGFGETASAKSTNLHLDGIDAEVGFSPYAQENSMLQKIADDISNATTSSVLFSLAFLYQTSGAVRDAITKIAKDNTIFTYGISDREVGGIDIQKPNGKVVLVKPAALGANVPEPFKSEPVGGGGTRLHHKFVVIDFDKPSARVYLGSYNFSPTADGKNGENLLLIRDRRIAVSYAVEAIRIFDHYHFRLAQEEAKEAKKKLVLAKPPRNPGERPWWSEYFSNARKILDREHFA